MKSGRSQRAEIEAQCARKRGADGAFAERRDNKRRAAASAQEEKRRAAIEAARRRHVVEPVDASALAPTNSYGHIFALRGFYEPILFACRSCGSDQVWTPLQQKWWCEVVKGSPYAGPSRCRACRAAERQRKSEARRIHLEGLERKRVGTSG